MRLAAWSRAGARLLPGVAERLESAGGEPRTRLREFLDRHSLGTPTLIAHRVVHGGAQLTGACRIEAWVIPVDEARTIAEQALALVSG